MTLFGSVMRRSAVYAVTTLVLVPWWWAQAQNIPIKHGQVSGIFRALVNAPSTAAGKSALSKQTCVDGTSLGGNNILVNCDSSFLPHNETSIAVDPNNPNHLVAGSNDYEISFVGRTSVQRLLAGYYTSFDGGTTWLNGHLDLGGLQAAGDPGISFNRRYGLVHYVTAGYAFGQGSGVPHVISVQVNTSHDRRH